MTDIADELLGPVAIGPGDRYQWQPDPAGRPIRFTIYGQLCSKANSYHIVTIGKRPAIVKSKAALDYVRDALLQIPAEFRVRLEGPVRFSATIWYTSELPDLDESLILDVLQDRWSKPHGPMKGQNARQLVQAGVYRNDRQVRQKRIDHGIDRTNPRVEILVEPLTAQQIGLL